MNEELNVSGKHYSTSENSTIKSFCISNYSFIYLNAAEQLVFSFDCARGRSVPSSFSINYFLVAGGGQRVRMYFSRQSASCDMAEIRE